jgi:hypothetical protein
LLSAQPAADSAAPQGDGYVDDDGVTWLEELWAA